MNTCEPNKSFTITNLHTIDTEYVTDDNRIFYRGIALEDAHPASFIPLGEGLYRAGRLIYLYGQRVGDIGRAADTFKSLASDLTTMGGANAVWDALPDLYAKQHGTYTAKQKYVGTSSVVELSGPDQATSTYELGDGKHALSIVRSGSGRLLAMRYTSDGVDRQNHYTYTTNGLMIVDLSAQPRKEYVIVPPGELYIDHVAIAPDGAHVAYTVRMGREIRIIAFPSKEVVYSYVSDQDKSFGALEWLTNDEYVMGYNGFLWRASLRAPTSKYRIDSINVWQPCYECRTYPTEFPVSASKRYVYYEAGAQAKVYDNATNNVYRIPTSIVRYSSSYFDNVDKSDMKCGPQLYEAKWIGEQLYYLEQDGPREIDGGSVCGVSWSIIKSFEPLSQKVTQYTEYKFVAH
jgi:hypothetical protein